MSAFHDCKITDMNVDFGHSVVTMSLVYPPDGSKLLVTFPGFVAAYLEDILCGCIVFDIEPISVDDALRHYRQTFTSRKNYGWPVNYSDDDDLRSQLGVMVISQITSSYGLSGFIISKSAPTCVPPN